MQKYFVVPQMMGKIERPGEVCVIFANEVARHVDELNAELEASRLREARLQEMVNVAPLPVPRVLARPPNHKTSFANNLTKALRERDTLQTLLIKVRDSGSWFISALELDNSVDGEELLKEIEALTGPRVPR